MPPTVMSRGDRERILERLRRVHPGARPRWGTLDAPRMLCHLADAMRVALGEIATAPAHNLVSRTLGKHVVVNTSFRAPPGRVRTAPEMLSTKPAGWDEDLRSLEELVARVGAGEASSVHPAFGLLSPEEWGRLSWKHIDHHLRQFGA